METGLTERNAGEGCDFIESNDHYYENDGGDCGEILDATREYADNFCVGNKIKKDCVQGNG